jgi:hypothetical protein
MDVQGMDLIQTEYMRDLMADTMNRIADIPGLEVSTQMVHDHNLLIKRVMELQQGDPR